MTLEPMTRAPASLPVLLFLICALPLAACDPPPQADGPASSLQLALVKDSAVFKVVQAFQVYLLKAQARDNSRVSCADFPAARSPEDETLEHLGGSPVNLSWAGGTSEATVERVQVPANQELVVLVLGLAKVGQVYTVARGCQEGLSFGPGVMATVDIDVKNTTGAPCQSAADCDNGVACQNSGQAFQGGYCAKAGCSGDVDCPPGSSCTSDQTSGGLCLRRCESQADCTYVLPNQAVQECVGRIGPSSGGCASVCVYPTWNSANSCQR